MALEKTFKVDKKGNAIYSFEDVEYYHGPYYKKQLKANANYVLQWLCRGDSTHNFKIKPTFERLTDICAQLPYKGQGSDQMNLKWSKDLQEWLDKHNLGHFKVTMTGTPHFHIHRQVIVDS